MNGKKVYVALTQFCNFDPRPRRMLQDAGFIISENTSGKRPTVAQLFEALGGVDAVIAGVESYPASLLAQLSQLCCISRCGAGTDAVDLEEARRRNIAVLTTPGAVIEPVAQMAVGMILALARNFPLHLRDMSKGLWKKPAGHLLCEWTIGLVGFGRVGRAVERYLRVFNTRITVYDPNVPQGDLPENLTSSDLPGHLRSCDLVSLHVSRTPQEGPVLGRQEIFSMKKGSRLVNTARGYLVDEQALYDALTAGHLFSAALDVFSREPYDGPLAGLEQVLCTPHVASTTRTSRVAMEVDSAQNVVSFFSRQRAAGRAV